MPAQVQSVCLLLYTHTLPIIPMQKVLKRGQMNKIAGAGYCAERGSDQGRGTAGQGLQRPQRPLLHPVPVQRAHAEVQHLCQVADAHAYLGGALFFVSWSRDFWAESDLIESILNSGQWIV